MMVSELMDALDAHGVTLIVTGGGVKVRAAAPVPDAVMAALDASKAEILAVWQDVRSSRDDLAGGTSEAALVRPASAPERWAIFNREQVSEVAFHEHRAAGFPYRRLPVSRCMLAINQLAATPTEKLSGTQTAYQVADTYHPERFHARSNGNRSPVEAFCDDELLRRALTFKVGSKRPMTDILDVLSHVKGTQACWNFRPGFALYLYRQYAGPGARAIASK